MKSKILLFLAIMVIFGSSALDVKAQKPKKKITKYSYTVRIFRDDDSPTLYQIRIKFVNSMNESQIQTVQTWLEERTKKGGICLLHPCRAGNWNANITFAGPSASTQAVKYLSLNNDAKEVARAIMKMMR